MSGVLADRFDVVVEGDTYTFKIPSITYDIATGYRAADVRRRAFPESLGALGAIDFGAVQFSRCCAYLELYLLGSSTLWPYGIADDSDLSKIDMSAPPKVDFEKFPVSATDLVLEVGNAFEEKYAQFRRPRHSNNRQAGAETVAGSQDPRPS
jgi:hypothetical protein